MDYKVKLKMAYHVVKFNGIHPYDGDWTTEEKAAFKKLLKKWMLLHKKHYPLSISEREEKKFVDFMFYVTVLFKG